MRSWTPELVLAAAGVLLGAVLVRSVGPAPQANVPDASSAPLPAPGPMGRCPQGSAPVEGGAAGDERLDLQDELEEIADLEAEGRRIGALPWPWPDNPEPHMRPEAVATALENARKADPEPFEGWEIEVDCSEYPCLVLYDGDASLERSHSPGFKYGYGLFSLKDPVRQREAYYPLPAGGRFPAELERRLEQRRVELMNVDAP